MQQPSSRTSLEIRHILALAWPVALNSLNWTMMHLADVIIVGHTGVEELGALAAARSITFISLMIGIGGLSGILVFVSRAQGAKDLPETGRMLKSGVLVGAVLGLVAMMILLLFAEPLVRAIGVADSMVGGGAAVLRAMALGYPATFMLTAASYFLDGISRPRRVLLVNAMVLPLNALLAWMMATGQMGLPAMGAVGAALATALASVFGCIAMIASAMTVPDHAERALRTPIDWPVIRKGMWQLLRFGTVPGLASGLELAGFSGLIALSTQLGAVSAAAFQMVFSLHNVVFGIAVGFAAATGVRVGDTIGAGQSHDIFRRTMIALGLVIACMASVTAVQMAFAYPILSHFSPDVAAVKTAVGMLLLLAPFSIFDGIQLVLLYALRSMKDQTVAAVNGVIAFLLVTGGGGWLLFWMGWQEKAIIAAAAGGMLVAALLQAARFFWLIRQSRQNPV